MSMEEGGACRGEEGEGRETVGVCKGKERILWKVDIRSCRVIEDSRGTRRRKML